MIDHLHVSWSTTRSHDGVLLTMPVRLSSRSICAFCRQVSVVRTTREPYTKSIHTATTAAPLDSSKFYSGDGTGLQYERRKLEAVEGDGPVLSKEATEAQLNLYTHIDAMREALTNDMRSRSWNNEMRLAVVKELDRISRENESSLKRRRAEKSPVHDQIETHQEQDSAPPTEPVQSFPLNGELMDHDQFRRTMANVRASNGGPKPIRRIIREQLLRCSWPREILRVIATAMQRKETARELAVMYPSLTRAAYRCRSNATDAQILAMLNTVIARFKKMNLPIRPEFYNVGIKFAARARSLPAMRQYLRDYRDNDIRLTSTQFRTIIAKCSVGARGLGEIRNGRWRRSELLQILLGFDDASEDKPYHLETFMRRDDWQYLHGWLTVLSRCRATDRLWMEWESWLKNPARTDPKALRSQSTNVTTRVRGDYWFIEQMARAGDIKAAWTMLQFSGLDFHHLRTMVQMLLLGEAEHATVWNDAMSTSMIEKYDKELTKIEKAFGAHWVPTTDGVEGRHEWPSDENQIMERLSECDTLTRSGPGYMWGDEEDEDEDPIGEYI